MNLGQEDTKRINPEDSLFRKCSICGYCRFEHFNTINGKESHHFRSK